MIKSAYVREKISVPRCDKWTEPGLAKPRLSKAQTLKSLAEFEQPGPNNPDHPKRLTENTRHL